MLSYSTTAFYLRRHL